MGVKEEAVRKIEQQQAALKSKGAPWYVGEQLKEICRREEKSAELLAQDLDNKEMGIVQAEKQIKAWADKHKTGNVAVVPPAQAEEILRKFYGLPAREKEQVPTQPEESGIIDLSNFL